MKFGRLRVSAHNFGFFRLDGGAMFGSVPKNLWAKRIVPDAENCIRLATRCLVVRDDETRRVFLIDCGMGEKWAEKQRAIFGIENHSWDVIGLAPEEVTDLILTHLHFDHAGGATRYTAGEGSRLEVVFRNAQVHLQRDNLENARAPSVKEKASYLAENFEPLLAGNPNLLVGDQEIFPGILVHQVNGHTRGQQWIEIKGPERSIFYPTDLIPTRHHLPVPFHMGYDACAETILREKQKFLDRAVREKAIVAFEHDADCVACSVKVDDRGHFAVGELVEI